MPPRRIVAIDFEWVRPRHLDIHQVGWATATNGREDRSGGGSRYLRVSEEALGRLNGNGDLAQKIRERNGDAHCPRRVLQRTIFPLLRSADFVVSHGLQAETSVLNAYRREHNLHVPPVTWLSTMLVARHCLGIQRAGLANVVQQLGLADHQHHEAQSDAKQALRIVLHAARVCGWRNVLEVGSSRTWAVQALAVAAPPAALPLENDVWEAVASEWPTDELIWFFELEDVLPNRRRPTVLRAWRAAFRGDLQRMLKANPRSTLQAACRQLGLPEDGYSARLIRTLRAYATGQPPHEAAPAQGNWRSLLPEMMYKYEMIFALECHRGDQPALQRMNREQVSARFHQALQQAPRDMLYYVHIAHVRSLIDEFRLRRTRDRDGMIKQLLDLPQQ